MNNYTDSAIQALHDLPVRYMVYGREVAPTTNTPHLQGYVSFPTVKSKTAAIKNLPGCHVEPRKGTQEQAIAYCKKDGQFTERGLAPEQNGGDKMKDKILKNKRLLVDDVDTLIDAGDVSVLQLPLLKKARIAYTDFKSQPRDFKTIVKVYIGTTGTGKSRKAHEEDKTTWTHPGDRWFDGYQQDEVVLFDDFEGVKSGITYRKFLQITDRYAQTVPVKNGFVNWRPKIAVFTTNIEPKHWYPEDDPTPLLRRIDEIERFPTMVNLTSIPFSEYKP